jgi:vitamin B12 transporter
MINVVPLLVLLLTCLFASGQTTISGKVKDHKGRPVAGASLTLKDTYDGGTTDSLGNFRFVTIETGDHTLLVSAIGYKPYEQPIALSGAPMTIDITLREEPDELKAVVITAGSFEASDAKRATVLNSIDVVTTAGANADVTGAIRTLPGAQQVGESEGLFVRGGTAQETKIFIDGTLVNNFFFSSVPDIAQRGRFSPFIFKGTVFSSGGYSALYGQALSSALILESVDLPEQSSASLGVSPLFVNGGFQQLSKKKNASWGITYNYTNMSAYLAVIKQRPDFYRKPAFHNGEFNFRVKTSKTGMLKFYGYFNSSTLGLRRPDIDSTDLKDAFKLDNLNVYTNLSWKERLGRKWRLYLGTSFSTNTDKIHMTLEEPGNKPADIPTTPYDTKSFRVKSLGQLSQLKAVLERRLYGLSAIRFGGEYMYFRDRNHFTNRYITDGITRYDDHFKAAFAEADIYVTNDIAAKIGTRYEHSSILERSNIMPRVSLAYKLGNQGQVSLAYGTFYQKPEKEFWLQPYVLSDLLYTRATHYIANYQRITRDYTLRIEAFYKKYNDLIKTWPSHGSKTADSVTNGGFGNAKGIELFWRDKKTIPNLDYWISYSYLDTKRDFLNYPYAIQPSFAAEHTASLVVKKMVMNWKMMINASYTFATGRPYYNIRYNEVQGKFSIADQGKTIPYHNLSISVNYLPNMGNITATRFLVWVFSLSNVLGSDQVFGYNYSANGLRKEPILPPARRFFFFGCFMSFGVDRSEDVINSNL